MGILTYTDRALTIELRDDDRVVVRWLGKSTAREPNQFVLPILTKAIGLATTRKRIMEIDFSRLVYMNSSTITPLIRVLEQAKRTTLQVKVLYAKSLKWQELSFSALKVFQTSDKRIEILGI